MSRAQNTPGLIVGGEPRIDFLPPEIKQKKAAKRQRGLMVALAGLVAAVCVVGYGLSATISMAGQANLAIEQSRTDELLAEQAKYVKVRQVANEIDAAKNARTVGSSTEILLRKFLSSVQATLPAGVTIVSVKVEGLSAFEEQEVVTGALLVTGFAKAGFVVTSPSLHEIDTWQKNAESLVGLRGSTVTPVEINGEGLYEATLSIALGSEALEGRFLKDYEATVEAPIAAPPAAPTKTKAN